MRNDVFRSREEAARSLARRLGPGLGDAVVLTIPTRGAIVGCVLAEEIGSALDIVVPQKIPIPWNPEAAMGAVCSDGALVLSGTMANDLGLSDSTVGECVDAARASAERIAEKYRTTVPPADITGRHVILVDDGISSGYTMLAAVRSAAQRSPSMLTIAVPVSSAAASRQLGPKVDGFIAIVVGERQPFLIEDYYLENKVTSDDSVIDFLARRFG